LLALVESQGIEGELIPRIATGFGGGFGGSHRLVCGAISGGVMAAGLAFGRDRASDEREKAYALVSQLVESFRAEFGTILCPELVGIDPEDEQWHEKYHASDAHQKKCLLYVQFVVGHWLDLAEGGNDYEQNWPGDD